MKTLICPYCGHENKVPVNFHNQMPLEHQDCMCEKCGQIFDFVYNVTFTVYRMDDMGNVLDSMGKVIL